MVEAEAVFGNKTPHFIGIYSDGFIIYHLSYQEFNHLGVAS